VEGVTCRLLPCAVADGPHQMAADEVLLESAAAGVASLRFYGWSAATLSLGYFQPERLRRADGRLAALPYVRRPSGGKALVHHHELTYALALPAGRPWQPGEGPVSSWLCRMHGIIATALGSLGVAVRSCASPEEPAGGGILCFQHLARGDLLIGSAKVVGSAQRRQRGALLQHGAVLLAASPHAPALPGIEELTGTRLSGSAVGEGIGRELARETGWELAGADWLPSERQRLGELVQTRYTQPAWNRKR
jgi:lipoate-protein ligase A